jgi:dihydroxyacid dehydratase/phosphogluconate dehydratase
MKLSFFNSIKANEMLNTGKIDEASIGGSTNVALHIPAIGCEADCEISMDLFPAPITVVLSGISPLKLLKAARLPS